MPGKRNITIWKLKEGDRKSFEAVFKEFYPLLYGYAKEYVSDHEVAREIVQDTFLKLWETRTNLADDTNLRALLYTITRNGALNYLKHVTVTNKYKEHNFSKHTELLLNYMSMKEETSEMVMFKEVKQRLDAAIEALPEKCREVFLLSRNEGLKYKEIAEKLQLSPKTVENHIAEALKRLKEEMKEFL